MRFVVASLLAVASVGLVAACGGKVLWVPDDGSGGAGSTSSGSSKASASSSKAVSSGSVLSCSMLEQMMNAAVEAARACNPALSSPQCDGSIILEDPCGCPSIVANEKTPQQAAAAKQAIADWKAAGCGPLECGGGCFPVSGGFCAETNNGQGVCIGFGPD